jgi:hypothetical protein
VSRRRPGGDRLSPSTRTPHAEIDIGSSNPAPTGQGCSRDADLSFVLIGVTLLFFAPFEILVHELAHAVVALLVSRGPVDVVVGKDPGPLRFRIGRLTVSWNPFPTRDRWWAGVCRYHRSADPVRRALVVAAGPAGDLVSAIVLALLARRYGPVIPYVGAALLAAAAFAAACALFNFLPALSAPRRVKHPDSDGARFHAALAEWRTQRDVERRIGRPLTRAEERHVVTKGELPRSATWDVSDSVAPPS